MAATDEFTDALDSAADILHRQLSRDEVLSACLWGNAPAQIWPARDWVAGWAPYHRN